MVRTLEQARAAVRSGRRITLRGGALAFDRQALGQDLVLALDGFDELRLDHDAAQLSVGASATWGQVIGMLDGTGLLPPIVVSASTTTIGGTISSNSISRFSPVFGNEGRSVRSLELLCADGEVRSCSRTEHPDLFFASVGGLGGLGVILSARYQLMSVPVPTRVCTRVERHAELDGLASRLRPDLQRSVTAYAVVAYSRGRPRVLLARASYCDDPLNTMLPHRPSARLRVPIEWVINRFPIAGQAFWNFAYDVYVREDRPYVDDLFGFTFFQDGNVASRRAAQRVGLGFRVIQQTFLIPEQRGELLECFVHEAEARLRRAGFHTALVDTLYVPRGERFALSSTRDGGGFVVTLTYEGPLDLRRLQLELSRLACDLHTEGGRVHLVKNVFAPPGLMEAAYAPGLAQWRAAKRRWDPERRFSSDFHEQVFAAH